MRLLFVTPYFPPTSGSGVPRGTKFIKYLLRDGWQVRVVTIDPSAWPDRDPSLLAEVDGAVIERVRLSRIPGVSHTVLRAVPGIAKAVRRSIAEFRPDVVLATGPDWHWLVTARAARRADVPYVLDYPDPWTVLPEDFRLGKTPSKLRSKLKWAVAPRVEGRILRGAAAAVFATAPIREAYVERWPGVRARSEVITNGFDEEDFEGLVGAPGKGPVRVVHVGSFGAQRKPQTVARAVAAAAQTLGAMELWLVGAGTDAKRAELEAVLGDVPLVAPGWVSHREAVQAMLDADVLWLDAMVHLRSASTGKLFEYLRAGRPIVALAHPESPAARIVGELRAGVVVNEEDPHVCGEAIVRAASEGEIVSEDDLSQFSRARLTSRLAEVLAEACG